MIGKTLSEVYAIPLDYQYIMYDGKSKGKIRILKSR